MLRYAFCPKCKVDIPIQSKAAARTELEDEFGSLYLTPTCPKCATKQEFHLNKIKAKMDTKGLFRIILLALGVTAFVTGFLWSIGFISTLSFIIPVLIIAGYSYSENQQIQNFNRLRVRRK